MSLFTAPQNLPFGIGFALIVGIALVEGAGMLISFSPSNLIDNHLPDLQVVMNGLFGGYLPAAIAGLAAVPAGLATVRGLGALIAHIIPQDETSAVSEQSLVGRVGVVVTGVARRGLAAQAGSRTCMAARTT
ncbi:hypothetical protein Ddc_21579 [Ditylenchus destructor]|nr:hypothetical protein Ddc_21579 [Ditylenchus destructor]